MDTIKFGDGCKLEIVQDDNSESPRAWDNIGQMICFHKGYNLGDEHEYRYGDFNSWEELQARIEEDHDVAHIMPLYLMDHSGISISTSSFGCRWDSGQIGFVFCTSENAKRNFGDYGTTGSHVKQEVMKNVHNCLVGEVETYDQYLRGDTYGFILRGPPCEHCGGKGKNLDSCWGFYGSDPLENGMMDHLDEKHCEELRE